MPTRSDLFVPQSSAAPGRRRLATRLLRLGVLAFWLPCLGVDLYMLWAWRGAAAGYVYGLQAVFRESVVFLALWFGIGAAQAILFSRTPKLDRRRPRRRDGDRSARPTLTAADLTRDRRGL